MIKFEVWELFFFIIQNNQTLILFKLKVVEITIAFFLLFELYPWCSMEFPIATCQEIYFRYSINFLVQAHAAGKRSLSLPRQLFALTFLFTFSYWPRHWLSLSVSTFKQDWIHLLWSHRQFGLLNNRGPQGVYYSLGGPWNGAVARSQKGRSLSLSQEES